ncbi:MAG: iron-containing alcohol dehydrogenase [Lachnospiraceae bacterium]
MNDFQFYMPTQVVYEKGALSKVGEYAAGLGKKALVLTDEPMMKTGLPKIVLDSLDKAGLSYLVWTDIVPNPRDVDIEKGAAYAEENGIDYLIAIGGGSSIDTAKAVGAILTNGGKCADLINDNLTKPIAPLVAIPTTCGTGSEVTHESIVNNTTTLEKDCIYGKYNSVSVAILDPVVLEKLPSSIMASTGLDALTHAVEAYVCKAANPLTDALAIRAIEMIGNSLVEAVETHKPEALEDMLVASCMAGAAFGNSDVASVHSIAEALGGYYDIAHGVANAMMLPEVSRLSVPGAPKRYADVAKALGVVVTGMTVEEAAYAGVDYIEALCDRLKIPKFYELDVVDPKDFDRLAKTAANASETFDNPVLMDEQAFKDLFIRLYNAK